MNKGGRRRGTNRYQVARAQPPDYMYGRGGLFPDAATFLEWLENAPPARAFKQVLWRRPDIVLRAVQRPPRAHHERQGTGDDSGTRCADREAIR